MGCAGHQEIVCAENYECLSKVVTRYEILPEDSFHSINFTIVQNRKFTRFRSNNHDQLVVRRIDIG